MNIQQLRQSLKMKWLGYYKQNRPWLVKIRVWGTYNGLRRPSSGFILATLSVLEPQLDEILPFLLDLNDNPDKIVAALGLNFNPDEELRLIKLEHSPAANPVDSKSVQDKCVESKPIPLVAIATKITAHSPVNTLHSEKLTSDLPRAHKPVSYFTATTEVIRTQKLVSSVAVATKIAPPSPAKPPSGLLRQHNPVRSPLAITTEVPSKAKTLPSLENGNYVKIQPQDIHRKVNLSPSTNARSLASWVDEFCQGRKYDPEEAISIRF
ncbi:hypothetical protein IQ243_24230 [Nostocales cyanobacterium LEGE 11386]|nr:hypothetical protein [Nostocales cyanobacterium LEGE 11386]